MDKLIEDTFALAQKNPVVAGILATIFGLYIVGKIETKTNGSLEDKTQPHKEDEIKWEKIILAQNENISDLTELVNKLIEKLGEN